MKKAINIYLINKIQYICYFNFKILRRLLNFDVLESIILKKTLKKNQWSDNFLRL